MIATTKILATLLLSLGLLACESNLTISGQQGTDKNKVVVDSFDKIVVVAGDKIELSGKNFDQGMQAVVGERTLTVTTESSQKAWIDLPSDMTDGSYSVMIIRGEKILKRQPIWVGDPNGLPILTLSSNKVCDDIIFKDKTGRSIQGQRVCSTPLSCTEDGQTSCVSNLKFAAVNTERLAEKIIDTARVAGITGAVSSGTPCSTEVTEPCLVDHQTYKAVETSTILPQNLRQGVLLGGVTGSLEGAPVDCSTEGGTACLTNADYPALASLTIDANQLLNTFTLGGITGNLNSCASDAQLGCLATPSFPAVDKVGKLSPAQLAKIKSGLIIAGVSGTLGACSSDGEGNCFAQSPNYSALLISGAAAKIAAGQSLAGVTGVAAVKPSDCSTDGGVDCYTTVSFPAVDKGNNLGPANAAKIRTGLSLAGVAGTLADCSSDGQTGCVVASADFAALLKTSAASKIISGQTLGGVLGTGLGKPEDCSVDGGLACVATSAFPAAATTGAAGKIAAGETLATVSGSAAVKPNDCSSDGEEDCNAVTSFPAVEKSSLAAKLLSAQTLGGVLGTAPLKPADCSTEGGTDCVAVANFPAVDKLNALSVGNRLKVHSSLTLVGVTGTMNSCASDGQTSCLTNADYLAANSVGAEAKILLNETVGGFVGTAPLTPAPCAIDGGTDCVTSGLFPAINKAVTLSATNLGKIRSGFSLAGQAGSLNDCSSEGDANCFTVSNYPAMLVTGAQEKVISGANLGGIAGNAGARPADCSSDGGQGCVTTAGFPAALAAGADGKIALGDTLAGIPGVASVRPSDCNADGAIGCIATTAFPAVDKLGKLSGSGLAKIKSDLTLLGATGTLTDCSSDGDSGCQLNGSLVAAFVSGVGPKVLTGESLAGVAGTALAKPANCSSDGQTNCVTSSSFPAIDKATKLTVSNMGKVHTTVAIGGVSGTLASCSSDNGTACLTTAAYPSMETSGAAAKILSAEVLGGVTGTGAGKPLDCSLDGATNCTTVTNFPSIDKSTVLNSSNMAKVRQTLTIAGVAGTLNTCSVDGASGCVAIGPTYAAAKTLGAAEKIMLGETVANISGSALPKPSDCSSDGATGCVTDAAYPAAQKSGAAAKIQSGQTLASIAGTAAVKPSDCNTDGGTACVTVSNFPAVNKAVKLTPNAASIHSSLNLAGVQGTLANCSSDGGQSCFTTTSFKAANGTGAPAKILSGTSLAGFNGTGAGKPNDCASDNATECTAVTNYPSVVKATISANAAKFRTGLTIAGVAGALANCSAENELSCAAVSGFAAGEKATAAPKILSGQTVISVAGTGAGKPADCNADNKTDCVTVTNYPSVVRSEITADILKNGFAILGVTGSYPSSTYPLAGSTTTNPDLKSSELNSRLNTSGTAFEWFDSAGGRYTNTYQANLTAANLKSGASVYGVTGNYAPPCTTNNETNCLSVAAYTAVKTSLLNADDIRKDTVVGTVTGVMRDYWANGTNTSVFNRTTGTGSAAGVDKYDTLSDIGNPGTEVAGYPGIPQMRNNWYRDPLSDSNSNGVCDGTEKCVYVDKRTKRMWGDFIASSRSTFDDARAYCEDITYGGYSDWRLAMEKEYKQAYIDGFSYIITTYFTTVEGTSDKRIYSASGRADGTWDAETYWLKETSGGLAYKPYSDARAYCVRGTD